MRPTNNLQKNNHNSWTQSCSAFVCEDPSTVEGYHLTLWNINTVEHQHCGTSTHHVFLEWQLWPFIISDMLIGCHDHFNAALSTPSCDSTIPQNLRWHADAGAPVRIERRSGIALIERHLRIESPSCVWLDVYTAKKSHIYQEKKTVSWWSLTTQLPVTRSPKIFRCSKIPKETVTCQQNFQKLIVTVPKHSNMSFLFGPRWSAQIDDPQLTSSMANFSYTPRQPPNFIDCKDLFGETRMKNHAWFGQEKRKLSFYMYLRLIAFSINMYHDII